MYIDVFIDDVTILSDEVPQGAFSGVSLFTVPADLTPGQHHFYIVVDAECQQTSTYFFYDSRFLNETLTVAAGPQTPSSDAYSRVLPETGMTGRRQALLLSASTLAAGAFLAGIRLRRRA